MLWWKKKKINFKYQFKDIKAIKFLLENKCTNKTKKKKSFLKLSFIHSTMQ